MIQPASLRDIPERCRDPQAVNAYLNAPEIRPTIGGDGPVDASALLENENNICLLCEEGGALFVWRGPKTYETHCFFFARGKAAIERCREMLGMMSGNLIWALVPGHRRDVKWLARHLGFVSHGPMTTPETDGELFVKE